MQLRELREASEYVAYGIHTVRRAEARLQRLDSAGAAVWAGDLIISGAAGQDYTVVDTGQVACYDDSGPETACPSEGGAFHGQDAQHAGHQPRYTLGVGGLTVHDDNTGLTWQQSPDTDGDGDIDAGDKLTWAELQVYPAALNAVSFGGYSDWRLPTIKELHSLFNAGGNDPAGRWTPRPRGTGCWAAGPAPRSAPGC